MIVKRKFIGSFIFGTYYKNMLSCIYNTLEKTQENVVISPTIEIKGLVLNNEKHIREWFIKSEYPGTVYHISIFLFNEYDQNRVHLRLRTSEGLTEYIEEAFYTQYECEMVHEIFTALESHYKLTSHGTNS